MLCDGASGSSPKSEQWAVRRAPLVEVRRAPAEVLAHAAEPAVQVVAGEVDEVLRNLALEPGLQTIWGQNRFPPPEKTGLVLFIEMGCTDTVPFPREPNTPFRLGSIP